MKKQIQPASVAKNSSRASTEAHETRKNKLMLTMFVVIVALAPMFAFGQGTSDKDEKQSSGLVEDFQVSGTVTNVKDGKPMPGVAVIMKGSTRGTVTDMNGKYLIRVPSDAILLFSFAGMATQEIVVGNRQIVINVTMGAETQSHEKIAQTPQLSEKNDTPLIVVNGKEGGDLKSISPENIESMTVLKDQAAIKEYGERGKNGVVLITTKK